MIKPPSKSQACFFLLALLVGLFWGNTIETNDAIIIIAFLWLFWFIAYALADGVPIFEGRRLVWGFMPFCMAITIGLLVASTKQLQPIQLAKLLLS